MKKLVLSSLTLCLSVAAFAQQPAPENQTTTPSTATKADTAQAVRVLFAKRRTGGWVWTAIGSAFALRVATVAANSSSSGSFSSTTGGTIVGVGLLGGVPAGIGISKLTRFSKAKEDAVLTVYSQSKTLPPYVSRRLKSKYFE